MKKPTPTELRKMVIDALDYCLNSAGEVASSENPQSKETYLKYQSRADAYQNILDAINGNTFYLKLERSE